MCRFSPPYNFFGRCSRQSVDRINEKFRVHTHLKLKSEMTLISTHPNRNRFSNENEKNYKKKLGQNKPKNKKTFEELFCWIDEELAFLAVCFFNENEKYTETRKKLLWINKRRALRQSLLFDLWSGFCSRWLMKAFFTFYLCLTRGENKIDQEKKGSNSGRHWRRNQDKIKGTAERNFGEPPEKAIQCFFFFPLPCCFNTWKRRGSSTSATRPCVPVRLALCELVQRTRHRGGERTQQKSIFFLF